MSGSYWKNYCTKKIGVDSNHPIVQVGYVIGGKNICYACRLFCVSKEKDSLLKLNEKMYCECDSEFNCIFKNCSDYTDPNTQSENHKNLLDFHDCYTNKSKPTTRSFDFEKS